MTATAALREINHDCSLDSCDVFDGMDIDDMLDELYLTEEPETEDEYYEITLDA